MQSRRKCPAFSSDRSNPLEYELRFLSGTWPFHSIDLLSLRLVGAVGARNCEGLIPTVGTQHNSNPSLF